MPVIETSLMLPVEIKQNSMIALKGVITDAATNLPLKATIEITDNKLNTLVVSASSGSSDGKYWATVMSEKSAYVRVEAAGYMFMSENVNINFTMPCLEVS